MGCTGNLKEHNDSIISLNTNHTLQIPPMIAKKHWIKINVLKKEHADRLKNEFRKQILEIKDSNVPALHIERNSLYNKRNTITRINWKV